MLSQSIKRISYTICLGLALLFTTDVFAINQIDINCTNDAGTVDISSCTFTDQDGNVLAISENTTLLRIAEQIDPNNPGANCGALGGNQYLCSFQSIDSADPLYYTCLSNTDNISCFLGDNVDPLNPTPEQQNNSISCSEAGAATSCTVVSEDAATIETTITDAATTTNTVFTPPERQIVTYVSDICSRRNVSFALQRDCGFLLTGTLNEEQIVEMIKELTPNAAAAPVHSSQTSIKAQNRNVASRISNLRRGLVRRVDTSGLQFYSNGRLLARSELGLTGGGASGDKQEGEGKLGVFMNGTVDMGDRETTANSQGFDFSGVDFTLGVDYRFTDKTFSGLAFGYGANNAELYNGRGKLDLNGFNLIFYTSFYPDPDFYIDANITFGGNSYDQQRIYTFDPGTGPVTNVANADYFGSIFSLQVTGGYDHYFFKQQFKAGPYIQIQHVEGDVDGYAESVVDPNVPGSSFAIAMDGQDFQSTQLILGADFSYTYSHSRGVLTPNLKMEMVSELKDNIQVVEGQFLGDPSNTRFRLPSDEPDKNYFNIGLGITSIFTGGQTVYFYYQTVLGYEYLTQHIFNAGVRWEF